MCNASLSDTFTQHPYFFIMAFNQTSLETHCVTFDRADQRVYVNSLPEKKRHRFVTYSTIIVGCARGMALVSESLFLPNQPFCGPPKQN